MMTQATGERGREIDGVQRLQPRGTTRLWYRSDAERIANPAQTGRLTPPSQTRSLGPTSQTLTERIAAAQRAAKGEPEAIAATPQATDRIPRPLGALDATPIRPRSTAPIVAFPVNRQPASPIGARQTGNLQTGNVQRPKDAEEWRDVPGHAPNLFLSATRVLDRPLDGVMLKPGVPYRVSAVYNGVAEVEVMSPDGATTTGYCAAVDLICIDKRFTPSGNTGMLSKQTGALGALQRVTRNLSTGRLRPIE